MKHLQKLPLKCDLSERESESNNCVKVDYRLWHGPGKVVSSRKSGTVTFFRCANRFRVRDARRKKVTVPDFKIVQGFWLPELEAQNQIAEQQTQDSHPDEHQHRYCHWMCGRRIKIDVSQRAFSELEHIQFLVTARWVA